MTCAWLVAAVLLLPAATLPAQATHDTAGLKLRLTLEDGAHVGRDAPPIVLPYATADSAGPVAQPFDLAKELGHVVVLVFYGRGNAADAATNWQAFATHEQARRAPDLVFAGVARDPVVRQVAFARQLALPFKLLSDTARLTARRYGFAAARFAVVVVGRDGRVAWVDAGFAPADAASYVHLDSAIQAAREAR